MILEHSILMLVIGMLRGEHFGWVNHPVSADHIVWGDN
jgi:hypothetical protein